MSKMIGYARVSMREQSLRAQLDLLEEAGCTKLFVDQGSGKSTRERADLGRLLEYIREGDVVVVTELSRLSRSLMDLLHLTERIDKQGAQLRSLKEPHFDTTTSNGKMIFQLMGVLAEFERERIRERTLEGLKAARAEGRIGGRPRILNERQEKMIRRMHKDDESMREIARTLNVSVGTISRTLKRLEETKSSDLT